MKFEIVITAWDDGLYRGRQSINVEQTDDWEEKVNGIMVEFIRKSSERYMIPLDDDIPF